jgi:hypothetical protein
VKAETAAWLIPTVPATIAAAAAMMAYRLQRRQNRDVMWEPHVEVKGSTTVLTIKNRGVNKATGVTVHLDPEPAGIVSIDHGTAPQAVDLGAIIRIKYAGTSGPGHPRRLTVRWRRRLRKDGEWSSII